MIESHALAGEFSRYAELRRRLIEAAPEIDEKTLLDTLEGATNLHEALGEVVRSALDDEALAEGLRLRLEANHHQFKRESMAVSNSTHTFKSVIARIVTESNCAR